MKFFGCFWVLLVLCIFPFSHAVRSQSVSGVPGYVRIPVATFNKDGSLLFGTSFLPQQHLPYTKFNRDAIAAYASLTFLSFIEVDLRVTRQLNIPEGTSHVVDRVPSIRFRILKEKKWVPAVALGFHDVLTSLESGGAHHFGASYVVVTKNFHLSKLHLDIGTTAGWGSQTFIWKNNELTGPFGGLSLNIDNIPWMKLLFDYDGVTFNSGMRFVCFKHLSVMAGTMNFDSFTGTISYCFNLIR
ncbi:MAG: YjbH domain-containing protein [Bacteroidetes bacterium]|nr:YjbH domain-containing protein [Bacteroidota bacterium]